MHPAAFEVDLPFLGVRVVSWYGLLTFAGVLAALWVARRELGRLGLLSPRQATNAVMIVVAASLAGGHLLFLLTPGRTAATLRSGSVLYGAIFGGALAVLALARHHGLRLWTALDAAAPAGVMPPLFGRLGCFMAGCCYGRETSLPLGVVFTDPACPAPRGLPLHPTQLYEAGFLAALFLFLQWRRKRKAFEGELGLLYLGLYSIARFAIEVLRGDALRGSIGPLSFSQAIAVPTLVLAASLYAVRRSRAAGLVT